jgi:hypothetical protein
VDDTFALWLTVMMFSVMTVGVTFILTNRIVELRHRVNKLEIFRRLDEDEKFWEKTPKREWVGLTDEEIYDYADKFLYQHGSNYGIRSFGKAIEAKLKEKNLG